MQQLPPHMFKKIHFVGIGGIGMSGIAEVLANLGYDVSGSDLAENANVQRLRQLKIPIMIGHDAAHVQGVQVVVVSTDIKFDNVEIAAARTACIPIIRRAEMLAELMRLKLAVAISGTHGKTTTTSLAAALFEAANLDPTVVNGGIINSYGTNARLGTGEWIVVEADESDGSFLRLPATIAVVTNIDPEHMNFYGTFEHLKQAFATFIERVPFYGLGVLCIDHPEVRAMLPKVMDRRIVTYGFDEDANIRGVNLRDTTDGTYFDVDLISGAALTHRSLAHGKVDVLPKKIKDLFLPMMGHHNVQNALSVIAIAQELGLDDAVIRTAFANFKGVKRRFSRMGVVNNITIIDDYAHHPVEIKTVLAAARQASAGRTIAIVQPHRYSRLQDLFSDFSHCFEQADVIVVAPVYSAGESPLPGITAYALANAIRETGKEVYTIEDAAEISSLVGRLATPGDMVVLMGAGTITHWAAALPEQLHDFFITTHQLHHDNIEEATCA